ncbi:hypothetical protein MTR67_020078 [Solanum verrucosum]|uniref:Uncharacterized protein n=1 Tax=Solanum verrucosum TaxID=315347 RepID=A0AAF0TVF9_SOLVR|nr:hypothetical protein MTR67_020078 [Solanum verrucosum]
MDEGISFHFFVHNEGSPQGLIIEKWGVRDFPRPRTPSVLLLVQPNMKGKKRVSSKVNQSFDIIFLLRQNERKVIKLALKGVLGLQQNHVPLSASAGRQGPFYRG